MAKKLIMVGKESLIVVLVSVILAGAVIICCAKTETQTSIVIKELGFIMKVPKGWKVGEPSLKRDKKWLVTKDGDHCFPAEKNSYPFGRVWTFPAENFSSLDEYVHTIPTLHGKTLQESAITVCGFDGIEVIGSGIGENQIPVKGIYQYFAKDDNFIVASFLTIADSFLQQESIFRAALKTIIIK
ncbi:MAG: hypothetical protein ABIK93_00735 [candidate division WOR-3 bacterium]